MCADLSITGDVAVYRIIEFYLDFQRSEGSYYWKVSVRRRVENNIRALDGTQGWQDQVDEISPGTGRPFKIDQMMKRKLVREAPIATFKGAVGISGK